MSFDKSLLTVKLMPELMILRSEVFLLSGQELTTENKWKGIAMDWRDDQQFRTLAALQRSLVPHIPGRLTAARNCSPSRAEDKVLENKMKPTAYQMESDETTTTAGAQLFLCRPETPELSREGSTSRLQPPDSHLRSSICALPCSGQTPLITAITGSLSHKSFWTYNTL